MRQKTTRLIVNPNADMGHAWQKVASLRPLVEELDGAEWVGTVYPTHATELARHAAEDGSNLVIAVGGDGTVHEVVNGLMQVPKEIRPRLGIIPLGSGNDFAHSIGIRGEPAEALKKAFTGQLTPLDVGFFELDDGRREYFNNTFGMGFDGTVNDRTHRIKHLRGFSMYFVAVLQTIILNHEAPRMQVTTDLESWEQETIMLTVCNCPREGGGFLVAPGADCSDGWLDYATVCHVTRLMMLRLIPEVLNGTHGRFKQVKMGRLHKMQVESEKPIRIHADGETVTGFGTNVRKVSVEVIPAGLEVLI